LGAGSTVGMKINVNAIRDLDRDSLYILPLAMIPFEHPGLRRARMVKNARMESVVELFSGKGMGSGQLNVSDAAREFEWNNGGEEKDLGTLKKLAKLPSFDIYSLRISLREQDIAVNDYDELKLSGSKKRELDVYMQEFTRQLVLQIYGDDKEINDYKDVLAIFQHPDVKMAKRKLGIIADKLDIRLDQIPKFFEDYGDVNLSLSYYRHCFDKIAPTIVEFRASVKEIQDAYSLKGRNQLVRTCLRTDFMVNQLVAVVRGRFKKFNVSTKEMWNNVSSQSFRRIESMIESSHKDIGKILCALTVKMDAWSRKFPSRNAGGPMPRAEFINAEIFRGLDSLR